MSETREPIIAARRARSLSAPQWVLFAILFLIAVGLAIRVVMAGAERMRPAASVPTSAALMPGQNAKLVVRVGHVGDGTFAAALLRRQSDTVYCLVSGRPDAEISVAYGAKTSIVMGQAHDIELKAVVQVAGAVDDHHVLQAMQIVILTDYVRVAEKPCH